MIQKIPFWQDGQFWLTFIMVVCVTLFVLFDKLSLTPELLVGVLGGLTGGGMFSNVMRKNDKKP